MICLCECEIEDSLDHECHCVYINHEMPGLAQRIAWGVCCAKYVVGSKLMLEEDFHRDEPWSRTEDCTCRR